MWGKAHPLFGTKRTPVQNVKIHILYFHEYSWSGKRCLLGSCLHACVRASGSGRFVIKSVGSWQGDLRIRREVGVWPNNNNNNMFLPVSQRRTRLRSQLLPVASRDSGVCHMYIRNHRMHPEVGLTNIFAYSRILRSMDDVHISVP